MPTLAGFERAALSVEPTFELRARHRKQLITNVLCNATDVLWSACWTGFIGDHLSACDQNQPGRTGASTTSGGESMLDRRLERMLKLCARNHPTPPNAVER
jgi:hypothetical protein